MFRLKCILLIFCQLNSLLALAQIESPKTNPYEHMINYYVCKKKLEKRVIWIEELRPKGCLVWYSSYKKGGSAASSTLGNDFCFQKSEKIRKNLENAQFECIKKSPIELKN